MANPFDDEPPTRPAFKPITRTGRQQQQDEWAHYENQIENAMQSTLDSTKRSLMMLEESEQAGIRTATMLDEQGEKLRKVDRNLDDINAATVQTQRNLNNIKSVFGGIRNYFSKKPPEPNYNDSSNTQMKKSATVSGASGSGLMAKVESTQSIQPTRTGGHTLTEESRKAIAGSRWEAMDNEIDDNLDVMSSALSRLRNMGTALGEEVDKQNQLLESINRKTDKTDATIRYQDDQMKKILGVKPGETVTVRKDAPGPSAGGGGSSAGGDGGWSTEKKKKRWFS